MHGEYKVPGGKLVVIDLEVMDGRLHDVELSGDFFLQPEDTLWRLRDVLEGVSADASVTYLSTQVGNAAEGAELIGITPEAIAIAVRRALGDAGQ